MHHGKILKDYIARKGVGTEAFANKLGVVRQSMYTIYGREEFDEEFIKKLEKAGIENAKDIFKFENNLHLVREERQPYPANKRGSPYLSELDIFAGKENISDMDVSEYITDYIYIPSFKDATYYVNVKGSSMYKAFVSGDIIAIKAVKDMTEIQYGSAYVIVTHENRVLKYVRKGSDDKHLLLKSENPKFDDYEIERKKIRAMFLVLGKITKDVL